MEEICRHLQRPLEPWKVNADPDRQVGSRSARIIPEISVNANPVDGWGASQIF